MEEESRAHGIQDNACLNSCTDRGRKKLENPRSAQAEETAVMSARRRRMEIRRLKMTVNFGNFYGPDVSQMNCSRMPSGAICSLRFGEEEIPSVDGGSDPMEIENDGGQDIADGRPPAGTSVPIPDMGADGRTCSALSICTATMCAAQNAPIGDDQPMESIDDQSVETPREECYVSINTKSPDEKLGFDKTLLNRSQSNAKARRTNAIGRANGKAVGAVEAKDRALHCPPHGFVSVIGRRREMEDAVAAVPFFFSRPSAGDLHFFGVYDGHGGSQASTFCKEYFHEALAEELRDRHGTEFCGREFSKDFWRKAMSACFMKVDSKVGGCCPNGDCRGCDAYSAGCCQETIAPENVGSTAIVAVIGASEIVIANCGDSRAVLSRGGKAVPLSRDHKPEREDERCRIEAAGGRVVCWSGYRVGGLLALSRSIGDRYLKSYVISEPEVTCTERTDADECLVLGSDGLWDVLSNDLACEVARKCLRTSRLQRSKFNAADSPAAAASTLLTKLALARGSSDNISVLVVDLRDGRNAAAMTSPPSCSPLMNPSFST